MMMAGARRPTACDDTVRPGVARSVPDRRYLRGGPLMSARQRTRALVTLFALLLAVYLVRPYLAALLLPTRILVTNKSTYDISFVTVEATSDRFDLGRLRAGSSLVLPRARLRAGVRYEIFGNQFSGDELLNYYEYALRNGENVRLFINENRCMWFEGERILTSNGVTPKRQISVP